jgi:hypothetical protein
MASCHVGVNVTPPIMGHAQVICQTIPGAMIGAADPRSDGQAWGL